jgi:pimeloyl-ACP methyl ester carboxylesterase
MKDALRRVLYRLSGTYNLAEVHSMPTLRSDDALLHYEVSGTGPDVVLLHPFPLNHNFWNEIVPTLSTRYRVITPNLRAHGESEAGYGPVSMQKLAMDLERLCRELDIQKALFVGVSIGGYALFEYWRQHRERFSGLVLSNTRASAENDEGRANRLRIAEQVLQDGTASFIEDMLAKLLSPATRASRPDVVEKARSMMQQMSPQDVAAVQRGMAARPDSIPTLETIHVPTLVAVGGDEARGEAELMHNRIRGSRLFIIEKAGHYSALEQPQEYARILRQFAESLRA